MGILTGRSEGIKLLTYCDLAFIGTLTDYSKGMSTRSLPPIVHYTLEFDKYEQIRGIPIENEEPHFHYMQTGSCGQIIDPNTHRLIPAPEPKRPKIDQLYLALLNDSRQIKQLVEITTDDIDLLRQLALQN
ncbi:unnamed protein product [Adineta steineri]|uniref:Uncharacterized protein n=1 Tax=Adineta steineri TaxID=433720 RepID=A0A818T2H3_9BILA|nr:unnamed protein product [Adineta steineri]CAF3680820.1 unnamed protein product [Adineta steineri]